MAKTIPFKDRFKTVGEAGTKAMSDVFKSRGFDNAKIITDWHEIVGPEISTMYSPAKIVGQGASVTLFLDPKTLRDRSLIVYNKQIILEKVNRFLGHAAIGAIKLINS